MTAIVDVGINIVASKALQGMKRIQDRTNQLAKSMTKFQRTSDRTWDKFGNKVRKTRRIVQMIKKVILVKKKLTINLNLIWSIMRLIF